MNPLTRIPWRSIPWRRATLIVFGGLLSYLVIPLGFAQYSEVKSLRDARRSRAVKFGERNTEFNSKINATLTLLRMAADHNERIKLSDSQLPDAQKDLYSNYRQRRLDLDEAAWWWPSEFAREAAGLDLLSATEIEQLNADIANYNASVLNTVNQVTYLWRYLDSPEYGLNDLSRKKRDELEKQITAEMGKEYKARNELVNSVSSLLSRSNHRSNTFDLMGL